MTEEDKQFIEALRMSYDKYMKEAEERHEEQQRQIKRSSKVLDWYSKNEGRMRINLMEIRDKIDTIQRDIEARVSDFKGVEKRKHLERILNIIWSPRIKELEARARNLERDLFAISIHEGRKSKTKITPDEIKDQVSILSVCDKLGIDLKNNRAVCPMHNDKDPSLRIYPATNSWYCFGACHQGGSVIDLIMAFQNCSLNEAINSLSNMI